MRKNYTERRFEMNRNTLVTVKTKHTKTGDYFENTVTIKHQNITQKMPNPITHDDVVELIKDIDLADDQASLDLSVEVE